MKENRFEFGSNWLSFLKEVDEKRINFAEQSLKEMLNLNDFKNLYFLDIGCGSGLFSLAAVRLGAKAFSFDYDKNSVICSIKLREKFSIPQELWQIEQGSILDDNYVNKLPSFDIVYAWGVLHHTGNMKKAIKNAASKVKLNGKFYISIYNDQGWRSLFWRKVKQTYCSSKLGKLSILITFIPLLFIRAILSGLIKHRNPFYQFIYYKNNNRGMSLFHDWIDWLGGLPYEVATPKYIEELVTSLGFRLDKSKITKSWGCNEFIFTKII